MPQPPDPRIGALRNTQAAGITVRLLNSHILHDQCWDELATAKGITWDATLPYMVVRYPSTKESIDPTGRFVLDYVPAAPFHIFTYSTFAQAQAKYIQQVEDATGKTVPPWQPGKISEIDN